MTYLTNNKLRFSLLPLGEGAGMRAWRTPVTLDQFCSRKLLKISLAAKPSPNPLPTERA